MDLINSFAAHTENINNATSLITHLGKSAEVIQMWGVYPETLAGSRRTTNIITKILEGLAPFTFTDIMLNDGE